VAKSQGTVERRVRAQLRAAGWTADSASEAGTLGAMAIDLAQTQDLMPPGRDKAAHQPRAADDAAGLPGAGRAREGRRG
jgi:hypothetical protein